MSHFLKYYFPILVWYSLIFYLSSFPDLKTSPDPWQDFVLRKLAHIFEYFILGFLLSRAFTKMNFSKVNKPSFSPTTFYLLPATLVFLAIADEIHQYFVPLRDGKIMDILIDTLGGVLGIIAFMKIRFRGKITSTHQYRNTSTQ